MITYCDTCKAEIVPEDVVVSCEGLCEDQRCFHARCVGLSYDEGCACLHRNIFWMCDSCRDSIERARFPMAFRKKNEKRENEFATKDEVNCLTLEVNRISEMMSRMMTNCGLVTSEPSSSSPKSNNVSHHDRLPPPLSSTKTEPNSLVAAPDESILQLYISNIAPDVTANEVKKMVCESIGARDVLHVKCLVPSWKNVLSLNYVSFKVTVNAQYRDAALRSSNWPSGVRCRMFRDLSDSVWRPSTGQLTI